MSFIGEILGYMDCMDKPYKYDPIKKYSLPDCTGLENLIIDLFTALDMFLEYYFLFYVNIIYIG